MILFMCSNEQLRRQICELHSQYTSLEQQLTQSQSWLVLTVLIKLVKYYYASLSRR